MSYSNQITELKLPDGRIVAFVDWTDRPQFSTLEVLNGTTVQEMQLFQYVAGDPVPSYAPVAPIARTSNENDTNMANPGAMASTEELLIYAIRPEIFRRHVADAEAPDFAAPEPLADGEPAPTPIMLSVLHHRLVLQLEISQKVYSMGGLGYFNWGAGMLAAGGEEALWNYGFQGLPSQEAVRSNVIPCHIGGEEKFRVKLVYIDDGTGNGIELGEGGLEIAEQGVQLTRFARIRVYLDGLYKRPVS